MSEVNAFKHTLYNEDVTRDKAVSEATQAKLAETLTWVMKNSADIIGQVFSGYLTEEQFAAMKDYPLLDGGGSPIAEANKKWVLHKGQSIVGSDFSNLTGVNTLQDLVTKEAHIAQALNSADLGTYQDSRNKSHSHFVTTDNVGTDANPVNFSHLPLKSTGLTADYVANQYTSPSNNPTSYEGGTYANPNRVMYNIFIKINW